MGFTEFKDGVQARRGGDKLQDGWDADKQFGWRLEDRVEETVPDHVHPGYALISHTHDNFPPHGHIVHVSGGLDGTTVA